MAETAEWVKLDEENAIQTLLATGDKLELANDEVVIDCSGVRRLDSTVLRVLEELADKANAKAVKLALRGVNVDVYKVLKLAKLASRFSFIDETSGAGK